MSISTIITLIVAVASSSVLAAIVTAFVNSKRNKAQNETEARAQNTTEFTAIVAQQNIQIDRLEKRVNHLEKNEDYIDVLIAGITNGTIPPIPPRI